MSTLEYISILETVWLNDIYINIYWTQYSPWTRKELLASNGILNHHHLVWKSITFVNFNEYSARDNGAAFQSSLVSHVYCLFARLQSPAVFAEISGAENHASGGRGRKKIAGAAGAVQKSRHVGAMKARLHLRGRYGDHPTWTKLKFVMLSNDLSLDKC